MKNSIVTKTFHGGLMHYSSGSCPHPYARCRCECVQALKTRSLVIPVGACPYLFSLLPFITLGRTAVARGLLTLERIPKSGLRMILLLLPCWGTAGAAKSKFSHSLAGGCVSHADVSSAVSLPPSTWQEIPQLKCYFCLGIFSALTGSATFIQAFHCIWPPMFLRPLWQTGRCWGKVCREHDATRIEVVLSFVTGSFNGCWLKWDSLFPCVKMVTFVYGDGRGKWGLELGVGFQACALVSQVLLGESQKRTNQKPSHGEILSHQILFYISVTGNLTFPLWKDFYFF